MNSYFESLLKPERIRTRFYRYLERPRSIRSNSYFMFKKRKIEIDLSEDEDIYWFKTSSFSFVYNYDPRNRKLGKYKIYNHTIDTFISNIFNLEDIHSLLIDKTFKKKNFILRLNSFFFPNIIPILHFVLENS